MKKKLQKSASRAYLRSVLYSLTIWLPEGVVKQDFLDI